MDTTSSPIMIAGNPAAGHQESEEIQQVGTITLTAAQVGNATHAVRVECGFARGFAGLQLIGHVGETCRDGKERVRTALEALGYRFPASRLVVSMTPADLKKDGSQFDLALAVSLARLLAARECGPGRDQYLFAAEVGLGGELRPVKGIVAITVLAMAQGYRGVVMARENLREASRIQKLSGAEPALAVIGFDTLRQTLGWVFMKSDVRADDFTEAPKVESLRSGPHFDDMLLTANQRLFAKVIATGGHSALLQGPPGTGKSMFAERIPSLLPVMEPRQHIEAMTIHSAVSERLPDSILAGRPPYRAPHHQASAAALMGRLDRPGELSLAHGGVLFLDELPEFRRDLLEALREPLENGTISVARAAGGGTWRCRLILLAACNNCPCGWAGSGKRKCPCDSNKILAYGKRISGPIRDRIDLHFNMPERKNPGAALFPEEEESKETTKAMAMQVMAARSFGRRRNRDLGVEWNRDLPARGLVGACGWTDGEFKAQFIDIFPVTASHRSTIRTLRVARTLADLSGVAKISREHLQAAWLWQDEAASLARGEMLPPA